MRSTAFFVSRSSGRSGNRPLDLNTFGFLYICFHFATEYIRAYRYAKPGRPTSCEFVVPTYQFKIKASANPFRSSSVEQIRYMLEVDALETLADGALRKPCSCLLGPKGTAKTTRLEDLAAAPSAARLNNTVVPPQSRLHPARAQKCHHSETSTRITAGLALRWRGSVQFLAMATCLQNCPQQRSYADRHPTSQTRCAHLTENPARLAAGALICASIRW
ncbi:MAG: hypothetical protein ACI8Z5_002132 [Lentimonas sp.]